MALAMTGTAAVVLGGAAVSWACTGQGSIMLSPAGGPAGTVVTVKGTGFGANSVDIRWGSASSTAPLLGTAPSGNFAVDVKIPDARSGVYYVVAVPSAPAEGTTERAPGSAAFTVTEPVAEPAPVTTAPQPQTAAPQPQPVASQPVAPQPQPVASQPSQAGAQHVAQAPQSAPVQASAPSAAPSATTGQGGTATRPAARSAPAPTPAAAVPDAALAGPVADAPAAPVPDPMTAIYTPGAQPLGIAPDPLPVPENDIKAESRFGSAPLGLEGVSDTDRLGAGVALGALLLGAGLVTVLGAGVVAVSRRRRASSGSVVHR